MSTGKPQPTVRSESSNAWSKKPDIKPTTRLETYQTHTPYARPFEDSTDRSNAPRTRSYSFGNITQTWQKRVHLVTGQDVGAKWRVGQPTRTGRIHTHERAQGTGIEAKLDAPSSPRVADAGGAKRAAVTARIRLQPGHYDK